MTTRRDALQIRLPAAAMSGVAYVDVTQTYYGDLPVVAHIIPPLMPLVV